MPEPLPLPLDYAQSKELRRRLAAAIEAVISGFIVDNVLRNADGVPVSGPDPRVVSREVGMALARIASEHDLNVFDTKLFDERMARLAALEAELTKPVGLGRKRMAPEAHPSPSRKPPPKNSAGRR